MASSKRNDQRKRIAERLGVVLASSYVLMLKTQNFHWNVTGPHFNALHTMFGAQYAELFVAIDPIAERMRALGEFAPGGLAGYGKLSAIDDAPASPPKYEKMLAQLASDHERLSALCGDLRALADEAGDTATGDLMNGRIDLHDKTAWMLNAHLA
ncbi:MAG: DNA starvation/stationary phase protection protein [Alphaproteobacteria bacterium]|nr:DNA starvation/stationary phase protection protein [Alphaproteobacteria bacterium]